MRDSNGHLIIATGGTGGHFHPALAVAREFQRQGGVVTLFIAGQRTSEHIEEARREGFVAFQCQAFRLPKNPLHLVTFPGKMLIGVLRAKGILQRLGPDFVLGMGSFASVPPCLAASLVGIPLFLHDGNAVIGRANRLLTRWATCLALSLPLAKGEKARCKTRVTGMPVRDKILQAVAVPFEREAAMRRMGLDPARKTLLAFGGSQGASFINGLVEQTVANLSHLPLQVVILTGREDNAQLAAACKQAGIPAVLQAYEPNIERFFAIADLVVCRSGGSTIAELALFGKPAVLVPIPNSSLDHQRRNAAVLQAANAAAVLDQNEDAEGALKTLVDSLFDEPESWRVRRQNIRQFGAPQAAADIVEMIFTESPA